MAATEALIRSVIEAENQAGKYFIFYCLMLFLLRWMQNEVKTQGKDRQELGRAGETHGMEGRAAEGGKAGGIAWGYGVLSLFAAVCPPVVYLLCIRSGAAPECREALLLVPVLFILAYGAVMISSCLREGKKRWLCVAACIFVIAMSGTFLPYKGAALKVKYADRNVRLAVEAVSAQKEPLGEPVVLLAQQEIMECARRYDGEIRVLYGKDLWLPDANTAVADVYPKEYIFVFERMKNDYEHPAEAAGLAERFGCNVVVLREKIPEGAEQSSRWVLAEQVPGYYIYRREA